jgi:hypothetical protein
MYKVKQKRNPENGIQTIVAWPIENRKKYRLYEQGC